jgi:hypothetical protein
MGVTLFHMDRRTDKFTDMMKLVFAFCSFADVPKMLKLVSSRSMCCIYRETFHNILCLCG